MASKKPDRKTLWMQRFQDKAVSLGAHGGQLDWMTATYLYNEGTSAEDAATRMYGPKEA